ncbi:translation initiation factor IF-5A [Methanothermobacter wolfeii]|uniref:Translation initiation factor 5A n=1 Tax=Methanothermobacter wolfeii TaxID=145261 RepID=A0A9E7RTR3_METWO|nr:MULTISPECIES: translation initiation factor IF-5A [Methanothermobacter]MDI6702288.1 translation initiation factor IF-5A [Methanothermobacter wolfeii]MDI6842318.1 translation initiation factor IF-5A [Methanothermobacter wolfeii]NLM03329.1 translation initiation factor IF-5A [Methanothermobacter wolfeii]QHN06613.1 translation initiation factor IF-5A [Methanothermobacter sp. THM-1]UXH31168.1 translation initiation factor IF-5A [Methanothermobacter wolfeii]
MSKKVVEVKTLKVGKYVIIDGEASKITNISTSSPGKHGSAKARVEAVGIFDNQKRSFVKPVDSKVDIPIIDKRTAQVLAIMGEDVQLMDLENYETFETPIPDELRDQLVEGVEVEYIEALGQRKLMRTKG